MAMVRIVLSLSDSGQVETALPSAFPRRSKEAWRALPYYARKYSNAAPGRFVQRLPTLAFLGSRPQPRELRLVDRTEAGASPPAWVPARGKGSKRRRMCGVFPSRRFPRSGNRGPCGAAGFHASVGRTRRSAGASEGAWEPRARFRGKESPGTPRTRDGRGTARLRARRRMRRIGDRGPAVRALAREKAPSPKARGRRS